MDSTIELGRGDVYVKSWSKQQRYSLSSSSGGSWLTLVSISDVDFCLRSSRDLLWQLLALSWQSTWTFILHTRHLKPWRVWPTKKKAIQMIDWAIDICYRFDAAKPVIKIDWVLAAWRLVNVYNSFASRCSECWHWSHFTCRCTGLREKMHVGVIAPMIFIKRAQRAHERQASGMNKNFSKKLYKNLIMFSGICICI